MHMHCVSGPVSICMINLSFPCRNDDALSCNTFPSLHFLSSKSERQDQEQASVFEKRGIKTFCERCLHADSKLWQSPISQMTITHILRVLKGSLRLMPGHRYGIYFTSKSMIIEGRPTFIMTLTSMIQNIKSSENKTTDWINIGI